RADRIERMRRFFVVALAVSAFIVIVPHLPSQTTTISPTFTQVNLVSDIPGLAKTTDPNLVNPWGMAVGLNSLLWVARNESGNATAYDGTGLALPSGSLQVVTIPGPGNQGTSAPTGVATNATTGFVITAGKSAPSVQLFATEDGTIAGWNSTLDPTRAVI